MNTLIEIIIRNKEVYQGSMTDKKVKSNLLKEIVKNIPSKSSLFEEIEKN